MAVGLSGCGPAEDEQLRERALQLYGLQQMTADGAEQEARRTQEATVRGIEMALEEFSDTDESLRRFLEAIREGEQQHLNSEAGDPEALRQRLDGYWATLEEGEIPDEYR